VVWFSLSLLHLDPDSFVSVLLFGIPIPNPMVGLTRWFRMKKYFIFSLPGLSQHSPFPRSIIHTNERKQ